MTPVLVVGAGLVAIALGVGVLRTFGGGFRIGRLLAAAPAASIADARALATSGVRRYVRIEGRVDADDEFLDEHGRPLVLRRVRLETRVGDSWRVADETRRSVPFTLNEPLTSIAIDADALDEGLVVIPRESVGRAGDAPGALPVSLDPQAEVRIRIAQISSVDHAVACGVPTLGPDGAPLLAPGLGRPLVLTTLGRDDAIRLLAGGSRIRPLAAGIAFAAGLALVALGLALAVATAVAPSPVAAAGPTATPSAASPSPAESEPPAALPGDTRSSGAGPGFVGAPLLAIGGVLAIALATIALTLLYVRLTGGPRPAGAPPGTGERDDDPADGPPRAILHP